MCIGIVLSKICRILSFPNFCKITSVNFSDPVLDNCCSFLSYLLHHIGFAVLFDLQNNRNSPFLFLTGNCGEVVLVCDAYEQQPFHLFPTRPMWSLEGTHQRALMRQAAMMENTRSSCLCLWYLSAAPAAPNLKAILATNCHPMMSPISVVLSPFFLKIRPMKGRLIFVAVEINRHCFQFVMQGLQGWQ